MATQLNAPARIIRYPYPCFWDRGAHCQLAIYPLGDGRTTVLCTDPTDNHHTPAAMVLELLIPQVCQKIGLELDKLIWIQRHPANTLHAENYSRVEFQANADGLGIYDLNWRTLTPSEWQEVGVADLERHGTE